MIIQYLKLLFGDYFCRRNLTAKPQGREEVLYAFPSGLSGFGVKKMLAILLFCTANISCQNEAGTETGNSNKTEISANLKVISAAQYKNLGLTLEDMQSTDLAETISVNGRVDVPPENIAKVSLPLSGFVKSLTHNVLPGKYVKKGSVLARTESMEAVQMQQDYLEKFTQNEFLVKELDRQKTLAAEDATARRKLQEAENNFRVNKAAMNAYAAKLQIAGISVAQLQQGKISTSMPVLAPFSGYVKAVHINTGSNFTPTDVLFELIGTQHLHVELKVFEKDAFKLKEGQTVVFNDPKIGGRAEGKVFLVGKSFEDDSRAVNVHVHLSDEKTEQRLIPGQYLNAVIQTEKRAVKSLPESAILQQDNSSFVYVLEKQDQKQVTFKKVLVETGATQDGRIEIRSPLSLQNVVVKRVTFLAGTGESEE